MRQQHRKRTNKDSSKVAGGIARSESLSPERRKEIATKAALARWDKPRDKSVTPNTKAAIVKQTVYVCESLRIDSDPSNKHGWKERFDNAHDAFDFGYLKNQILSLQKFPERKYVVNKITTHFEPDIDRPESF